MEKATTPAHRGPSALGRRGQADDRLLGRNVALSMPPANLVSGRAARGLGAERVVPERKRQRCVNRKIYVQAGRRAGFGPPRVGR